MMVKGFEVTLHRLVMTSGNGDGDSTTATFEPLGEPLLIDLGDKFPIKLLSNETLNSINVFGLSFSEDGTRLLVGTPLLIEEVSPSVFSGRIWIYEIDDSSVDQTVWNEMSILKGSEPSGYTHSEEAFGSSDVILSGDGQTIAVIGSSSSSSEPQQVIHLLKYDGSNDRWAIWDDLLMTTMFVDKAQQEEGAPYSSDDQIMSIDMNYDGTILVVGVASASSSSSNYVVAFDLMKTFEKDTNAMIDEGEGTNNVAQMIGQVLIDPVDANSSSFFGYSLDLSNDGTRLAVGSPGGNGGVVYLYDYNKDENKWIQAPTITMGGSEAATGTYQGYSVSLSTNRNEQQTQRVAIGVPNVNGCDVNLLLPIMETTSSTTTTDGPSFCEAGYTQIYEYTAAPAPANEKEEADTSLDVIVEFPSTTDEDEQEMTSTDEKEEISSNNVITLKDGLSEEASWPGCIIDEMTCEGCRAMIQAERNDLQVQVVAAAAAAAEAARPSKEEEDSKRYLRRQQVQELKNEKRFYLRRQMLEQDPSTSNENDAASSTVVQVICSEDDRVLEEPRWNVQELKH
jgi:hypothetical protein